MTKQEANNLKKIISNSYFSRSDYPPYALASWDDRVKYKEYIFRIIDESVTSNSSLDNLKQAKELLKLVGNDGKDMLPEDFENDDNCPYDNIYTAIQKIDIAIQIITNESEYNGN